MRISDWSSDVCSSDLRHEVGAGGGAVLERDAVAGQVLERTDVAVAAGEEHRVVPVHAVALGDQHRDRAGLLLELHRGSRCLGDPVDAAAAQVAGHLLRLAGHQDRSEENTSELQSHNSTYNTVLFLK